MQRNDGVIPVTGFPCAGGMNMGYLQLTCIYANQCKQQVQQLKTCMKVRKYNSTQDSEHFTYIKYFYPMHECLDMGTCEIDVMIKCEKLKKKKKIM